MQIDHRVAGKAPAYVPEKVKTSPRDPPAGYRPFLHQHHVLILTQRRRGRREKIKLFLNSALSAVLTLIFVLLNQELRKSGEKPDLKIDRIFLVLAFIRPLITTRFVVSPALI